MDSPHENVNALLMSGGGIRSYGWDVSGFVRDNSIGSVLFVPYALVEGADCDNYDVFFDALKPYFADVGVERFDAMHHSAPEDLDSHLRALQTYDSLFVMGGNTFKLLDALQSIDSGIETIRKRVFDGALAYMGISAGSGVACRTIQGTNDDPIVNPRNGFGALGLVPFNVKPHYFEPTGQAESQEVRIRRYLNANDDPLKVVGLPERTSLRVSGDSVTYLAGPQEGNVWVFEKGEEPKSLERGSDLSFLLE